MKISNMITVKGTVFEKIILHNTKYIKIIPCYDIEHGIVLKIIEPPYNTLVLGKSWISITVDRNNELFRFRCPSFLFDYKGADVQEYEDCYPSIGEICRLKLINGNFSKLRKMVHIPRSITYNPKILKDGKIHISFAYIRNKFPPSLRKDLYISTAPTTQNSIDNKEIILQVLKSSDLDINEKVYKMSKAEFGFISRPLTNIYGLVGKEMENFNYKKGLFVNDVFMIYFRKARRGNERSKSRTGQSISGIRKRAIRARRIRNENRRAGTINGGKNKIFDFQRRRWEPCN